MHFAETPDQAKEEFLKRFDLSKSVLNDLGLTIKDVEMAIRFTEDFYNENKDFITELYQQVRQAGTS